MKKIHIPTQGKYKLALISLSKKKKQQQEEDDDITYTIFKVHIL